MKFLDGQKTNIGAALCVLATIAQAFGWLDPVTYQTIIGILAPTTAIALRAGVKKSAPK